MIVQTEQEKVFHDAAGNNYKSGYNCAESVFRAFCELLSLNVSPDALRAAAGFGGGMTFPDGPCGAASGAVMTLGLLAGRTAPDQLKKPMSDLTHEFLTRFSDEFGGRSCGCLIKYEAGTTEQKKNCLAITAGAAAILLRLIKEKGLVEGL